MIFRRITLLQYLACQIQRAADDDHAAVCLCLCQCCFICLLQ